MRELYNYRAKVREVHDGDTYLLAIDEGFGNSTEQWIRLQGIDVWELSDPKGRGRDARAYAEAWLAREEWVYITTFKNSKGKDIRSFVRFVADVYDSQGMMLRDALRANGFEKTA